MTTLPRTPSKLINLALDDLEKVESDPRYTVDMSAWHVSADETCFVCLAGAVMAKTLGTDPTTTISVDNMDEVQLSTRRALYALDDFRVGHIDGAIRYFDLRANAETEKLQEHYEENEVPPYSDDPGGFKLTLRDMAECLAEIGL